MNKNEFIQLLETATVTQEFIRCGNDWDEDSNDSKVWGIATKTLSAQGLQVSYSEQYSYYSEFPESVEFSELPDYTWVFEKIDFVVLDDDAAEIKKHSLTKIMLDETSINLLHFSLDAEMEQVSEKGTGKTLTVKANS